MVSYELQYFHTNADGQIEEIDFSQQSETSWLAVFKEINRAILASVHLKDFISPLPKKHTALKPIQILFVYNNNLRQKSFYYNLCCNSQLRRMEPPLGGALPSTPNFPQHPIITIGLNDVMPAYEESLGLGFEDEEAIFHWKQQRKKDKLLYQLQLDHRVKFLDSSIWHRYLPLLDKVEGNPAASPFAMTSFGERLIALLNKIMGYYELGLYNSVAAVTTLEFNCRMLLNSFIHKAGVRGHHEAVTPFKFHSETLMESKCKKLIGFLEREGEGKGKLAMLRWNILMIDDHSDMPLSSVYGESKGRATAISNKKHIIEQLLGAPDASGKFCLSIKIGGFTKGDTEIIGQGIQMLKHNSFDILLLDYLLGQSETEPKLKAYGHEFLLETATGPDRRQLRRGPMGQFWIYPISSFPHAFTDKLRQLNIDGPNRLWYVANGGDPITAPELFRVNFYRLLLRQITEYYLHDAALARWTTQFMGIKDRVVWCRAIKVQAEWEKQKLTLAANYRETSTFMDRMDSFLFEQKNYEEFWESLKKWLKEVEDYERGRSLHYLFNKLHAVYEKNSKYENIFKLLEEQLLPFIEDAEAEIMSIARKASKDRQPGIIYKNQPLYLFPKELPINFPEFTRITLNNTRLTELPASIAAFSALKFLDLSDNQSLAHIPAKEILDNCTNLSYLNLRNTKIEEEWRQDVKDGSLFENTKDKVAERLRQLHQMGFNTIQETKPNESPEPVSIFLSHAPSSAPMKGRLLNHLTGLINEGNVEIWDESMVLPGEDREAVIGKKATTSDLFLCMLDVNSYASWYLAPHLKELKARSERKECIPIPIYLDHFDYEGFWISQYSGLPQDPDNPISDFPNKDDAWKQVAIGIRRAVETILSSRSK